MQEIYRLFKVQSNNSFGDYGEILLTITLVNSLSQGKGCLSLVDRRMFF